MFLRLTLFLCLVESKRRKRNTAGQLKRETEMAQGEDIDGRNTAMGTPIPVKRKKIKQSSGMNKPYRSNFVIRFIVF